jgi:hypothetical protein
MSQDLIKLEYSFGLQKLQIFLDRIKQDLDRADQAIKNPADELYEYITNLKREVKVSNTNSIYHMSFIPQYVTK